VTAAIPLLTILLLGAFLLALFLRDRVPAVARHEATLIGILAAVALLPHVAFVAREGFNLNEFFHYYVGTKYFPEVGYSGLYEATVVADYEDDPSSLDPDLQVRSLRSYQMEPRPSVIARADAIRARFSPERWEAFRRDIAYFREVDGVLWKVGESLQDHGYNGSPLVTAILGGLARQPFLSSPRYIRLAAWLDVALVVLAGVILSFWVGPGTGALFIFLWAVNPFNDAAYTGGAYLRHLHLLALLVAILAYARGRMALSGGAFAVAGLLRVFPCILIAGLAVQNLIHRDRRLLLRRHAPLFAAVVATALIVIAATSLLHTPDGENAWVEFTQKISLHSQRLSVNVLGLSYLFFYKDDHNVAAIERAWEEGRAIDWAAEAGKTLAANRGPCLGVIAVLAAALLVLLRRGRPDDGLFAGVVLVFACLHLAHYDYAVLALVPFIFPERRDALVALTGFWIAVAAARFLPQAAAIPDFRFFVLSALTALYFAVMLALRLRDRGAASGGAGRSEAAVSPSRRGPPAIRRRPGGSGAARTPGPAGAGRTGIPA
jgi:hypothetical protein